MNRKEVTRFELNRQGIFEMVDAVREQRKMDSVPTFEDCAALAIQLGQDMNGFAISQILLANSMLFASMVDTLRSSGGDPDLVQALEQAGTFCYATGSVLTREETDAEDMLCDCGSELCSAHAERVQDAKAERLIDDKIPAFSDEEVKLFAQLGIADGATE